METLLNQLRAVAEPTRLRLLALLAQGELTVSELTQILGQSQPRVSRHLKLLCDAGLLSRFPEGAWVFYRLSPADTPAGAIARTILQMIPREDLGLDQARLSHVRQARQGKAQEYFADNAWQWNELRQQQGGDHGEAAIVEILSRLSPHTLVDMGTGTGRVLELAASHIKNGIGFDLSHAMLGVARANLDRAGAVHCMVRQGDITRLPLDSACADVVTLHQVLHYLDDPKLVLMEAARLLRPHGRLLVVDFAPHDHEVWRDRHAHRRLGFSDLEMSGLLAQVGLVAEAPHHLEQAVPQVVVWTAVRPASAPM